MEEKDALVEMIQRQTNYTSEEAKIKLELHQNNAEAIIREYLQGTSITSEPTNVPSSTNQRVYSEIRKYLDNNQKVKN